MKGDLRMLLGGFHGYFIHDGLRFSSDSIEPIGPLSYVIQILKTDDWVV